MRFDAGLAGERRLVTPGFLVAGGEQFALAVEFIDRGRLYRTARSAISSEWRREVVKAKKDKTRSVEQRREIGKWAKHCGTPKDFEQWIADDGTMVPTDWLHFLCLETIRRTDSAVRTWAIPFRDPAPDPEEGERSPEDRLDDEPGPDDVIPLDDLYALFQHEAIEPEFPDEMAGRWTLKKAFCDAFWLWRSEMENEATVGRETAEGLANGSTRSEPDEGEGTESD